MVSVDCPPVAYTSNVVEVLMKMCLPTIYNTNADAMKKILLITSDIGYSFVMEISVVSKTFQIPVIQNTR